jgi:hypothetical protein
MRVLDRASLLLVTSFLGSSDFDLPSALLACGD